MRNQDNRYSPEAQGFSHSDPYDTRTYHTGRGYGSRDYMPSGRGSYEFGDMETRWDQYNAANYGRNPSPYRSSGDPNGSFERDDYRYTSGNREWHLNQDNHNGRNDRMHDRYDHPNRYADMHRRNHGNHGNRDVFEWVGSGISRAWNGIARHSNHDNNSYDRDRDYHQSYRNERESYGVNEDNIRRFGNKAIRGYEKGHSFGDDTPERQQQIGDRNHNNYDAGYRDNNRDRDYWNPDGLPPRY